MTRIDKDNSRDGEKPRRAPKDVTLGDMQQLTAVNTDILKGLRTGDATAVSDAYARRDRILDGAGSDASRSSMGSTATYRAGWDTIFGKKPSEGSS